jgi:predicted Kef-type K+ transport protein
MEILFSSIDYKDPVWIAVAFIFGFAARGIGLPPLVGFLMAGFTLNYLGAKGGEFLNEMADVGVTLLLFTIGLKLRVKELLQAEIWGVTLIHVVSISAISTLSILLIREMGLPLFKDLNLVSALMIGFALSFSSTVFVVKVLEDRGDFLSKYGRLAIGILIVQDIAAVVFIGISDAKIPSVWAAPLLLLIVVGRPVLIKLLEKVGHGELLVLFGLVLGLGGATLFTVVDLKADLGALVFGILLASHPKSEELAKALFSIKELFLVGFFLSIGMAGLPTAEILIAVAVLSIALLFKSGLFFLLLTRFRVRARPAAIAALILGNYSEFGLIVVIVAVSQAWLTQEWLVAMAVLVACSFVLSSIVNNNTDELYIRFRNHLKKFQTAQRLKDDEDMDLTGVRILVCGMGRVGMGAYDHLIQEGEVNVLGLDFDVQVVEQQSKKGRKTCLTNAASPDFWSRLDVNSNEIERVLLCAPNLHTNTITAQLARSWGYKGYITAVTRYPDEEDTLTEAGVDAVFNIYAEAGAGLAQSGQNISTATESS